MDFGSLIALLVPLTIPAILVCSWLVNHPVRSSKSAEETSKESRPVKETSSDKLEKKLTNKDMTSS